MESCILLEARSPGEGQQSRSFLHIKENIYLNRVYLSLDLSYLIGLPFGNVMNELQQILKRQRKISKNSPCWRAAIDTDLTEN